MQGEYLPFSEATERHCSQLLTSLHLNSALLSHNSADVILNSAIVHLSSAAGLLSSAIEHLNSDHVQLTMHH